MFVCLFSFHLYFVSLFVCFGFFVQVSLGFLAFTFPVGIRFPFIAYVVDPCPCFSGFLLHSFSPGWSLHYPIFALLPVSVPRTSLALDGAVECVFAPATLS